MLTYSGVGTIFVGVGVYRIRSTSPKHPAHSAAAYCFETKLYVRGHTGRVSYLTGEGGLLSSHIDGAQGNC